MSETRIVYGVVAGPYDSREEAEAAIRQEVLPYGIDKVEEFKGEFERATDVDGSRVDIVWNRETKNYFIEVTLHDERHWSDFSVTYTRMKKDLRRIKRRWKGLNWVPVVYTWYDGIDKGFKFGEG